LSADQVADHAAAGLTGFAGELTDVRLERYAALAAIPLAEVAAETGSVTMGHVDTTGRSPVDVMRTVETTEAGVLFDGRDGTLTLHNRSHRYLASPAVTLDAAEHEVEADLTPTMDATQLVNDVTGTNAEGTITARVVNITSRDEYGQVTSDIETAAESGDEPHALAGWLVSANAEPRTRVPTLTVTLPDRVGAIPDPDDLLALTIGDLIEVQNLPGQAEASTARYFVEGYTETIGTESYSITFNVSPEAPYTNVFVLDDADRGELDGGMVLGL